ncbi:hypothetical protein A5320_15975 [Rheinheimera sp. SA_1]|uniref:Eco47II family restriction endonuclease n=1 Tax=Rheinheimera sp. SA_1 TaxID=1827365 RepID=UPI0008013973|nr:Eco47II family restriction endonuclease [Rheinheimera sp. SA_1]OBP14265.1 hypothetical protein A5320_15975 [Rheinheimera sp. SA_1]
MSYLEFINDSDLKSLVKEVLEIGFNRQKSVEKDFSKNVIDPFATIFDAAISGFDHETWKKSEMIRQCQKTLTNHIGALHQKILGKVNGWQDLNVGAEFDLINKEKKIIAEVKNKHNTLTGGRLAEEHRSLHEKVSKKSSTYHGYTAYFVTVVPKSPARFDRVFQPSDRALGKQVQLNDSVRIIDGASFYELVTGRANALKELYEVLPVVIKDVVVESFGKENFEVLDVKKFGVYFNNAYELKN